MCCAMRHNQSMDAEHKRDICAFKGLIIDRHHTHSSLLSLLGTKDRHYKMCYQFLCGAEFCFKALGS